MCDLCWEHYGAPRLTTPAVRVARDAIAAVFALYPGGGPAHMTLDDWNLEDEYLADDLRWVPERHRTRGASSLRHEPCRGDAATCVACQTAVRRLTHLQTLTLAERAAALALYDGYFAEEEAVPWG